DDSTPADVPPTYKCWEDIPPVYATLRIPQQFANGFCSHGGGLPPRSPSHSGLSSRPTSTPPSPTPIRVSKRKPLHERFNISPEAMDAAARDGAHKQVQKEMDAIGMGWAGPLARDVIPTTA
ncbi:hypothetical protein CALVIDRAFT_568989, partial [Calocera viscosa TUFC12733]